MLETAFVALLLSLIFGCPSPFFIFHTNKALKKKTPKNVALFHNRKEGHYRHRQALTCNHVSCFVRPLALL